MRRAIKQAEQAADLGEVPVGAIIVDPESDTILAEAHNMPIRENDPTAHAEILAIRQAAQIINNYRLLSLNLYVTLEPCAMCAGAISHARIAHVYFGATDPKGGAIVSGGRYFEQPTCHWRPGVTGGILEDECAHLLKSFFKARRSSTPSR